MASDDLDAAVRKAEQEAAFRERETKLRNTQEAQAYARRVRENQRHLDRLRRAAQDFVSQAAEVGLFPQEGSTTQTATTMTFWRGRRKITTTETPATYWTLQASARYSAHSEARIGYYISADDPAIMTGDSFAEAKPLDPADATAEQVDLLISLMAQRLVAARSAL